MIMRRIGRVGEVLVGGIDAAFVISRLPVADLIQKAAGISGKPQGLGQIVTTINGILDPLLVVSVSVGTLALIAGGAALMLGHPRAMRIIGGVVAGLILIGGAKGIIA